MNPQMDVLYVPDLGHVLAAFTRAAEPDQIEALRTNLDTLQLRTPRNYCIQSGNPPLLEFTQTFTAAATSTAVTLTAGVPAAFAAGTKVQVLIEGPSLGSPQLVTLPPTSVSGSPIVIPVPALASGSYYAIVFVPLYPITAASFTVP